MNISATKFCYFGVVSILSVSFLIFGAKISNAQSLTQVVTQANESVESPESTINRSIDDDINRLDRVSPQVTPTTRNFIDPSTKQIDYYESTKQIKQFPFSSYLQYIDVRLLIIALIVLNILAIALIIFSIWMFIDVIFAKDKNMLLWCILIFFTVPFGAIVYYFNVKKHRKKSLK